MSTSKMKVLALCGFTQNAYIYSRQLGAIRKACKDVDFVFLEPPHIVQKADMPWASNMDDFGSSATTEEEQQSPETTPRAWWLSSGDKKTYRLFDETVSYLHKALIEQGPFDGILGFSQGACMAATLAALLEKPGLHANFPSEPSIPKFKFVISVGGFLPVASDPSFIPYFPLPQHLPVLHVMGKNDTLVTPERSQSLVDACLNSRVELHDGGHFTPSKASWRHFLHAYILSFADGGSAGDVGPIASFGPSGANTPKTGTVPNTPRPSSPNPSSQATPDKPTDSSKGGSSAEDPAPSAS